MNFHNILIFLFTSYIFAHQLFISATGISPEVMNV